MDWVEISASSLDNFWVWVLIYKIQLMIFALPILQTCEESALQTVKLWYIKVFPGYKLQRYVNQKNMTCISVIFVDKIASCHISVMPRICWDLEKTYEKLLFCTINSQQNEWHQTMCALGGRKDSWRGVAIELKFRMNLRPLGILKHKNIKAFSFKLMHLKNLLKG